MKNDFKMAQAILRSCFDINFSLVFNFLIEELTHFIINSRLNK